MNSVTLEIEVLSPVAISARSATVGGHETLSYLPGSQILGAVAALLGLDPSAALPADARRLLLSGAVRFGDAWPVDGRQLGLPAPLSLYEAKGSSDRAHWNLAVAERPREPQLERTRVSLVTADGREVRVAHQESLRTAVEEEGRAREGFLFGIDAIEPGQRFCCRIDADELAFLERVVGLLDGRVVALGRSRSAEFGQVRVRRCDAPAEPETTPVDRRLILWLVSDLALRDARTGAPRLTVDPADLGLPDGWTVDWKRSFVRTRRYSPFNGARRRPDLERQVVAAGSVLTFGGPAPLTPTQAEVLRARLRSGIGDHVHEGLGRAILNPALLARETVHLDAVAAPEPSAPRSQPEDTLGRWLAGRLEEVAVQVRREDGAIALSATLKPFGILPAQWGEVRRLARDARLRGDGGQKLVESIRDHLARGQRLHGWKREARQVFLDAIAELDPETVERACQLAVRKEVTR